MFVNDPSFLIELFKLNLARAELGDGSPVFKKIAEVTITIHSDLVWSS